jgi:hypothetical protein
MMPPVERESAAGAPPARAHLKHFRARLCRKGAGAASLEARRAPFRPQGDALGDARGGAADGAGDVRAVAIAIFTGAAECVIDRERLGLKTRIGGSGDWVELRGAWPGRFQSGIRCDIKL